VDGFPGCARDLTLCIEIIVALFGGSSCRRFVADLSNGGRRLLLPMLLFLGTLATSPSSATSFDPFKMAGIDRRPNAAIPLDGSFADEAGQTVTLRQFSAGKPMLLVPVLHNCPNICGVTLSGLMEAIKGQRFRPPLDFTVVAFGIDPKEGPKQAQQSLNCESGFRPWQREASTR